MYYEIVLIVTGICFTLFNLHSAFKYYVPLLLCLKLYFPNIAEDQNNWYPWSDPWPLLSRITGFLEMIPEPSSPG